MDKYDIMLDKLSCVCGIVQISNFLIHITVFSFAAPGHLVVFYSKTDFQRHTSQIIPQRGEMFILSVTLHDYIIVIIQSFGCSYKYAYVQPGGGDDEQIKERLSYTVHV